MKCSSSVCVYAIGSVSAKWRHYWAFMKATSPGKRRSCAITVWSRSANACANWAAAYDANAKANGITDGWVKLGTPMHVDVDGDSAYVVVPATYTYKQHGKPVAETGSVFTVALKKTAAGWRITAWAWGEH